MLTFIRGSYADIEAMIHFLDGIKAGMEHREWLYLDPPEVVHEMMSDGTMILWLAMDQDRIAAVFSVLYPGRNAFNYGYDLHLSETELMQVIHMDTVAVHPDYRGLKLQQRLMQMAEQELSGEGMRILLSTVHPDNSFSLNNLLELDYQVQKKVKKFGSERFILRKNIF